MKKTTLETAEVRGSTDGILGVLWDDFECPSCGEKSSLPENFEDPCYKTVKCSACEKKYECDFIIRYIKVSC